MRVHVIHAHPVETSFNRAVYNAVLDELQKGGNSVDALDLYAEGFDPVLSRQERIDYEDPARNLTDHTKDYAARLLQAEAVIFVHPVWNYGYPAILKGYFDRVFVPGVSFVMSDDGPRSIPVSNFKHIRHVLFITTYGGNRWRTWLMGDPPRRIAKRWAWVTFRTRRAPQYLALYDMNNNSAARLHSFIGKVRRTVRAISS